MVEQPVDRLVIILLHQWQLKGLLDTLRERRFTATVVDATGGLLRERMVTLVVGTSKRRLPYLFTLVRDACPASTRYLPLEMNMPFEIESELVEVRVGGAIATVVPVEQFVQL